MQLSHSYTIPQAMPQLRQLAVDILPLGLILLGFVVNESGTEKSLSLTSLLSPVSIIPLMWQTDTHTHISFIYYQHYKIWAIGSIIKYNNVLSHWAATVWYVRHIYNWSESWNNYLEDYEINCIKRCTETDCKTRIKLSFSINIIFFLSCWKFLFITGGFILTLLLTIRTR